MSVRHAAVWIDQHEARILHVALERFDESTIHAPHGHIHRHPKGPEGYKATPTTRTTSFAMWRKRSMVSPRSS
jgi:hypothetical protein